MNDATEIRVSEGGKTFAVFKSVVHQGQEANVRPLVEYYVLVPVASSKEEIEAAARRICEIARQQTSFSALWLWFYDNPELVEWTGPPLGSVRYSMEAATGDPDTHTGQPALVLNLRSVDWADRPTEPDVEIFTAWNREALHLSSSTDAPIDPDAVDRTVAARLALNVSVVRSSVRKCNRWGTMASGDIY